MIYIQMNNQSEIISLKCYTEIKPELICTVQKCRFLLRMHV